MTPKYILSYNHCINSYPGAIKYHNLSPCYRNSRGAAQFRREDGALKTARLRAASRKDFWASFEREERRSDVCQTSTILKEIDANSSGKNLARKTARIIIV